MCAIKYDRLIKYLLAPNRKFWLGYTSPNRQKSPSNPPDEDQLFQEAVKTLQLLKTTFSPIEKLLVIRSTFQKMTTAVQQELGEVFNCLSVA